MQPGSSSPRAIVIYADETADWQVAGLRQIDRLQCALRDAGLAEPAPLLLSPEDNLDSLGEGNVLVLNTRLVLGRDFAKKFHTLVFEAAQLRADRALLLEKLRSSEWPYLMERSDIPAAAARLFDRTGKPQDGIISRFLNRPISRAVSQLLARTPITANQLTVLLMLLPLAGALLLGRGDYLGFALGAILFQVHSALDGCDGEIARVKYLESEAGAKLDQICDRLSTLLFAIALGLGLTRATGAWSYLAEGISAAIFIGVAETYLTRDKIADELPADRYGNFLSDHRASFNQGDQLKLWLIRNTGLLSLGEGAASLFGQLTKRDVFNFVFMVLAICGLAAWVLHILAFSACLILVLALNELFAPALGAKSAA